jgi:hypothetical protein
MLKANMMQWVFCNFESLRTTRHVGYMGSLNHRGPHLSIFIIVVRRQLVRRFAPRISCIDMDQLIIVKAGIALVA